MFFKIVILGTVHWKVILGNQNGSMASLQKHPFGTFIFKSVKPDIFDIVGTSLPSPARAETILKYELMFIWKCNNANMVL